MKETHNDKLHGMTEYEVIVYNLFKNAPAHAKLDSFYVTKHASFLRPKTISDILAKLTSRRLIYLTRDGYELV